jgi:hypothetical protein
MSTFSVAIYTDTLKLNGDSLKRITITIEFKDGQLSHKVIIS